MTDQQIVVSKTKFTPPLLKGGGTIKIFHQSLYQKLADFYIKQTI